MAIEQGEYRYFLNGRSTAVRESWSRVVGNAGDWTVESERRAPGVHLAVRARGEGRRVRDFAVTWESTAIGSLAADYRPAEHGLSVRRWRGSTVESLRPACPPEALLSPLMRVFAGPLIAEILASGGTAIVVVPDIRNPADPLGLLRPLVSERSARLVADDGQFREVDYQGDLYGPGTRFWLGPDDLLQRYCWRQSEQQEWDVRLERKPVGGSG